MTAVDLIKKYKDHPKLKQFVELAKDSNSDFIGISGLSGSSASLLCASSFDLLSQPFVIILSDKEDAAYFFNDLENLMEEKDLPYEKRRTFIFPSSYKNNGNIDDVSSANVLLRSEVVNKLAFEKKKFIIVTYPEAVAEKVVSKKVLKKNTLSLHRGENTSVDFIVELLNEYGFDRVDFVVEPGQFSLRGGIIDVFSFSNDFPYRLEILGDNVESIRLFNPETQTSFEKLEKLTILPDINELAISFEKENFFNLIPSNAIVWAEDTRYAAEVAGRVSTRFRQDSTDEARDEVYGNLYIDEAEYFDTLKKYKNVEFRKLCFAEQADVIFNSSPQPSFNKNFKLLISDLQEKSGQSFTNIILSDNIKQIERIKAVFETILDDSEDDGLEYEAVNTTLHAGFFDNEFKIALYTDHQIFDRYHRYRIRDKFSGRQVMTIKELGNLQQGDFVTHVDHGIGIFSGLEKIEVNGRFQEAVRLKYKDGDVLYVSIHSLHRISKYSGKEGHTPAVNKIGTQAWANLKKRTKKRLKDIAKSLIKLYAERKSKKGFAFSPDSYLQNELEASFIYEDTPDQVKATADVKCDMEQSSPMDRLICGDVGFGKTEIAIRAAFKAVAESKQVAVLVPTTILALQHYQTFKERLKDFPCNIDYISRFKTSKEKTAILNKLKKGEIDIIIGTHRLVSKDVKFKDLGLLIIDEEQKFGVSTKEKLKQIKVNVDTLTLTATPIPRTLQFSLMGARDLSQIHTPPPNRYPIVTELHIFNKQLIKDVISFELNRGGQVFFVHNRVQNISEVADIVQSEVPHASVAIGHGQMEGKKLEEVMVGFVRGDYDVLVSTTIIESGLDIPNANTIIINNAQNFGLSDLHQMRGRVGRSNKKAFCYLLTPPLSTITNEARKRLRAIEEFSDLGSGFNIAMRDLDIRGAGNIFGAEQSGFISEVGFDMYHKILDEAILELKESEYSDLFSKDKKPDDAFVKDCQIETDMELHIPTDYVYNIEERLNLYKELNNIGTEDGLNKFSEMLKDRFGEIPSPTLDLFDAVRLRWYAKRVGFTKVVLKQGVMIAFFVPDSNSEYYESGTFSNILSYLQSNPRSCRMKESGGKLTLKIKGVDDISRALHVIKELEVSSRNLSTP